ncbi:hypothetical protein [Herbaspirillum autotrophicum]|uniref:hypothetical protein n=1 Tax=Herbaspirillum autotrophicum TaxID=180195 RepID=UPI00067B5F2D|nr:hypothetical protein [Herbaspirillum autotrophicum]
MKSKLLGVLVASMFTLPVWADGNGHGQSSGSYGGTPTSSSSSSATGGAGGAGGTATGGAATGGNATNTISGVSGGKAIGNNSTVSVSVSVPTGSGTSGTSTGASGTSAAAAGNTQGVDYSGSYTVKTVPNMVAPSLTTTLSDTCMGSSSFGLSVVGFGATGGTTMVDQACVRRLDSREFRAMGMNDVALALLCQSESNRKAVESTGRSCPSVAKASDTAQSPAASNSSTDSERYTDPAIRRRLGLDPLTEASAKQEN